jgi:DNA invertase Pin-like site-specific DNA recombinase
MIYGYLRGSTGEVDTNNQKEKIKKYCLENKVDCVFVEDTISSGKPYEKRKISSLIENAGIGDTIIVAELSRFARNTEETLMIARISLEKKINLIILNPMMKFDDAITTKAILTIMGLSAEMERYFIKTRTKIAFDIRKKQIQDKGYFTTREGAKRTNLGTERGSKKELRLFEERKQIYKYLDKKLPKASICKLIECTRPTLNKFLKRHPHPDKLHHNSQNLFEHNDIQQEVKD